MPISSAAVITVIVGLGLTPYLAVALRREKSESVRSFMARIGWFSYLMTLPYLLSPLVYLLAREYVPEGYLPYRNREQMALMVAFYGAIAPTLVVSIPMLFSSFYSAIRSTYRLLVGAEVMLYLADTLRRR